MDNSPGKLLLNIREAAAVLGVSERTIRRLVKEGKLPTVQIGSRRLFRSDTLREWVRTHEQHPAPNTQ
jgi:excisionase family DNA binding protein